MHPDDPIVHAAQPATEAPSTAVVETAPTADPAPKRAGGLSEEAANEHAARMAAWRAERQAAAAASKPPKAAKKVPIQAAKKGPRKVTPAARVAAERQPSSSHQVDTVDALADRAFRLATASAAERAQQSRRRAAVATAFREVRARLQAPAAGSELDMDALARAVHEAPQHLRECIAQVLRHASRRAR